MVRQVVEDVVVTKLPVGTRADDLTTRLGLVSHDPVRPLWAAPLTATPLAAPDGRLLVLEPRTDLAAEASPVPWREVGALVARLQACPTPATSLPEHGGRAALTSAVTVADGLHPGGGTDILRELGRTLLRTWPAASGPLLTHGALHLGHVGRLPGTPGWVLTNPATLGLGNPTWDLGRPAGLWAAGLLDDASWQAFLAGYREAGGAAPSDGTITDDLEHPARCAVYLATVRAVAACGEYPHIELTPLAEQLLSACVRMNGRRWVEPDRAPGWSQPGNDATPDAHGLLGA